MKKMLLLLTTMIFIIHDSFAQETLQSVTERGHITTTAIISGAGGIENILSYNTVGGSTGTVSNHPLSLYAGGSEWMRILQNGNIGIGTTTPTRKLEIISGSGVGPLRVSGVNGSLLIDNVGLGENYYAASVGHYFQDNADNIRMVIRSDGNVGVGTATPVYRLDVNGNGNFAGNLRVVPASEAWAEGISFSMPSTYTWGGLRWKRERSSGDGNWAIGYNGIDATDDLVFTSNNNGAQVDDILRLTKSGNVGIGTTEPASRLDVHGVITSTGNSATGSTPVSNIAALYNGLRINGDIANHSQNGITYQSGGGGGAAIAFYRGGSYQTGIDFYTNQGDNIGGGNMTHRMRLTDDGKLAIGTVNPGTYRLAVEGTIGARKIKVTQESWSDYVFDSCYQLAPLQQVEKFIQVNKHLPDVPSAAEVKKEGLDVGDNQAVLLKKIEELTLYIINQEKRIQELEAKVK